MALILEHLNKIIEVDATTMTLLIMIAGIASMSVRNALVIPGFVVILMPMILGLSLVANYVLVTLEVFLQAKVDQWVMGVIAAGTLGSIVGIGITAIGARLLERLKPEEVATHMQR